MLEVLYSNRPIPPLVMEQRITCNVKLGNCPTVSDRLELGKGLVKAIRAALA